MSPPPALKTFHWNPSKTKSVESKHENQTDNCVQTPPFEPFHTQRCHMHKWQSVSLWASQCNYSNCTHILHKHNSIRLHGRNSTKKKIQRDISKWINARATSVHCECSSFVKHPTFSDKYPPPSHAPHTTIILVRNTNERNNQTIITIFIVSSCQSFPQRRISHLISCHSISLIKSHWMIIIIRIIICCALSFAIQKHLVPFDVQNAKALASKMMTATARRQWRRCDRATSTTSTQLWLMCWFWCGDVSNGVDAAQRCDAQWRLSRRRQKHPIRNHVHNQRWKTYSSFMLHLMW